MRQSTFATFIIMLTLAVVLTIAGFMTIHTVDITLPDHLTTGTDAACADAVCWLHALFERNPYIVAISIANENYHGVPFPRVLTSGEFYARYGDEISRCRF